MTRTVALIAAAFATHASAHTVNFSALSNNSGDTSGINNSATLSADASTFTVTLFNNSTSGSIANFYIEQNADLNVFAAITGFNILNVTGGPQFVAGGSPNLPAEFGNAESGSWAGNFFSMSGVNPKPHNGVLVGESITVVFDHDGGFNLNALIQAIDTGQIRMAQHFIAYGPNGESEWLTTTIIPLPPAAWAGLGTLGLIAGVRTARRSRRL
ncbi:MAG: hypothetical protein LAT64_02365 [Phycisphaerales bacterium]|nr:hypothetical protein [Planctomycetota bacterium]MCH8507602.1 hypothetical protein [Phycisphaerales bacterium]